MSVIRDPLRNLALILLGIWLTAYLFLLIPASPVNLPTKHPGSVNGFGIVSAAVVATAIITFFGCLRLTALSRAGVSDSSLRSATAAAAIVTYLVFVGAGSFFRGSNEMPEMAKLLLTSFTATVGVIIAFYFGSSAYVAARKAASSESTSESTRAAGAALQTGLAQPNSA